jgi:hypothetical protein
MLAKSLKSLERNRSITCSLGGVLVCSWEYIYHFALARSWCFSVSWRFRWGRSGQRGQCQQEGPFSDVEDAKKSFCEKFHSKTGNDWDDRAAYVSRLCLLMSRTLVKRVFCRPAQVSQACWQVQHGDETVQEGHEREVAVPHGCSSGWGGISALLWLA